jgi:hypothetical protein
MDKLMTKHFSKWASKQNIPENELSKALTEVQQGKFETNLGGNVFKKRIRFEGKGKSGSGRTILCYKKGERMVFVHGFAKNEKSNLSKKELVAFKELSKILLSFSDEELAIAIENGNLVEVTL